MEREEFADLMSKLATALVDLDNRTASVFHERPTPSIKAAVEALHKAEEDARPAAPPAKGPEDALPRDPTGAD